MTDIFIPYQEELDSNLTVMSRDLSLANILSLTVDHVTAHLYIILHSCILSLS